MKLMILLLAVVSISVGQDKQLYTCGMHPNVIRDKPGICPICEMDLTPIKKDSEIKSSERKILYWRAPMNPNEIYDKAGKSNMGMDLVPVYSDEVEGASVKISAQLQQNMGVRTVKVSKKPLVKELRTTGNIQFDETRVSHITLKYDVWIEHSFVNFVGQYVKKGEVILKIYSPELVNAQQEYLNALKTAKVLGDVGNDLITASTLRLKTFEISEETINEIKMSGKASRAIKLRSPISGVVNVLKVKHGHFTKKGEMLMEIVDMSKVWLMMDIYEKDLPFISTGQDVFVTLPYDPNAKFTGKIDYIFPVLDQKTRSVKARVVLHNPNERLKVNMFANAKISSRIGGDVLAVPSEALIRTGSRQLVILANGDNTFTPRDIKLGYYLDGFYEIKAGLELNDLVVSSAQFMIDSESKLKEAIQKMIGEISSVKKTENMNTSTAQISLPSIQCDQCVETIKNALKDVSGIESVHIDLEKKKTHIYYDSEIILQKTLEKLIAESGYHANNTKRLEQAYEKLAACCKEDK
jgi:RND family efflux transporter MFP subunit